MTENHPSSNRAARLAAGFVVVAASLAISAMIVGVGFAGGSISAAQYQYGKVTICHHTHSKKHPTVTITISQHAWPAHQRHGDTMGACPATSSKHHGHGNDGSHGKNGNHGKNGSHEDADSSTTSTATTSDHGHGNGNGKGNGNSNHGHK